MANDDFDVESLAQYLHLTTAQVAKMADRSRLPGRKIGGQWRFSQAEIHHWLEDQIGASGEPELLKVEGVLTAAAENPDDDEFAIADLLPVEAIAAPLNARTRNSVITSMVELATQTGMLWDPDKMADLVRARESLHPTALDNGVALLHPRRPVEAILAEPFLALGLTHQGIPFGGARGRLTDVFFLICSVDDRGHLRTLARLSRLLADPQFLDTLRELGNPRAIHEWISEFETSLDG